MKALITIRLGLTNIILLHTFKTRLIDVLLDEGVETIAMEDTPLLPCLHLFIL